MEGHGRHLEQQTHDHEHEACQNEPVLALYGAYGGADAPVVNGTGHPVEQGGSHEEEGGGEGAQYEVLQCRLLAEQPAVAGGGRQDVQRQRDHLQDDEQRDEVAAGSEEHHATQGEQGQGEDLGGGPPGQKGLGLLGAARPIGGLGREGAVADGGAVSHHQDGQKPDDQENTLGGDGEGVLGQARRHASAR